MKSTRRLSQRDVNSLTFNCATWLFSAFSPWSSTHARCCVNNALHACTCVELTDGPIPLVVVPGIRNAINIITFDYTEEREGWERERELSLYPRFPGYRVDLHEIACFAHRHVCVHIQHSTFVSTTRSFDYFTASARIKNIASRKASTACITDVSQWISHQRMLFIYFFILIKYWNLFCNKNLPRAFLSASPMYVKIINMFLYLNNITKFYVGIL